MCVGVTVSNPVLGNDYTIMAAQCFLGNFSSVAVVTDGNAATQKDRDCIKPNRMSTPFIMREEIEG